MKNLILSLRKTRSKHLIKAIGTYYKTFRISNKDVEVFINPTRKEMLELTQLSPYKAFRFFADNMPEKFYAWDAEIYHSNMYEHLKLELSASKHSEDLFYGTAKLKHGRFTIVEDWGYRIPKYRVVNWAWTNKYVNINEFLNKK
jgi:hypothetical protein